MASQNLNLGTSANSNDGDTLRGAFIKLKKMFAEVYGQTYSEQGDLSGTDFKINESKLQLTASGTASDDGKVLTYDHATGGFSWEDAFSGTIGDITGIVAGAGLTGSSLSSDEATLDVGAGTGITVTADAVSLATSVQDEIDLNTAKTGITSTQASEIAANTLKDTDQTVVLTEGANVTITGTYPNFTIASDDVVGAVTSVNGDDGVVVLDTSDVAENTNLYYTEARVSANADVTANTAKTGITTAQAAEIAANTLKDTDQTVTLTEGANVTITGTYPDFTIASDDVVGAVTSVNGDTGVVTLGTDDVDEGSSNLYYTEARVAANTAVALNTAKTGITTAQADDITANNAKVSNATHTGDVTGDVALTIASNVVNADKLDVTGNGTAGQLLQSDGDGSMTWVTGVTGDITAVTAGDGLTGGGTGGDVTLNVVGGDGITAAADEISLSTSVAGDGLTLTSGVLSVDTIQTGDVADDAITSPKLAEFDDTLTAATSGDIIVSNGTDFIHATMSGDATIVSGGAITIADNAVDYDKLADEFTTSAAISALDVDFSSAAIFTKTLSATTTLTFSNVETGMVKTLIISGNQSLVLPSGVTILNGAYLGTATKNVIQIVSTNGSTEMFATISNV